MIRFIEEANQLRLEEVTASQNAKTKIQDLQGM